MTKAEIIEVLTEAGVEFDSSATKAELEALLPVNEEQNGVQQQEAEAEAEDEEVTITNDNAVEVIEEAIENFNKTVKVFDKRRRLMRTFTGKNARKDAEALASQPRRDGWIVV